MGKQGRKDLESQLSLLQKQSNDLQGEIQQKTRQVEQEKAKAESASQREGEARRRLQHELTEINSQHTKKMAELEETFHRQTQSVSSVSPTRQVSPKGSERAGDGRHREDEASPLVNPSSPASSSALALVPPPDRLQEEADRGVGWRELHDREEQRAFRVREELQRARAEMSTLEAATSSEMGAMAEARHELLERQQAEDKVNEEKLLELKETERKSEKFQQAQEALEREAKALQRQLSEAMYDVGKKDREQQLKEAELNEVRQSIHSIQDEMDEVNRQLQAQCGRVQRVESSLRHSRDLGSKVQTMREMLIESHTALGQLCGQVEQERTQRGECSQGLRQQQMRTELLLQLLSHFKSRTQDLAPQVLLSQATEFAQGQMGVVSAAPEPTIASSPSAVPPLAEFGGMPGSSGLMGHPEWGNA